MSPHLRDLGNRMAMHENASLTPKGREAMALSVIEGVCRRLWRRGSFAPRRQVGRTFPHRGRGGLARPFVEAPFIAKRSQAKPSRACRLALLWQIGRGSFVEEFCAVGTSPARRAHEEVKDGLPDGRQARLWRRSPDSFFSVPRP